jgi:fructose/tagatose bisphosphate aldolase
MPHVRFTELMTAAETSGYAVGYFESWNMESLFAVADAAVSMRSPVILGFSGIHFPLAESGKIERLGVCAKMAVALCESLPVPACVLFNESPYLEWVLAAIPAGFDLVMFTDEKVAPDELESRVRQVVAEAHAKSAAVEAEMMALAGVDGHLASPPGDLRLTDAQAARAFVERTGVDALAVNVGQAHVHGRSRVHLDLARIRQFRQAVSVPLVLHGATSVEPEDLAGAIRAGIRKVNVGSALKSAYFDALREACSKTDAAYNPYEVVGSGLNTDVLAAGRRAITARVEQYMRVFGSAGRCA